MKHTVASLTIGACLLLPSSGVVLAANLHTNANPSTVGGTGKGQVGATTNPLNPNAHACTPGGPTRGLRLVPSTRVVLCLTQPE